MKNIKADGGGQRFNKDKIPMELVPPSIIFAVGEVLKIGAKKYSARNWERGMRWTIVYGCIMRHLMKWASPFHSDIDEESGLNHLWHVASNVAMLIEYERTCKELDDRPKYRNEIDEMAEYFCNTSESDDSDSEIYVDLECPEFLDEDERFV